MKQNTKRILGLSVLCMFALVLTVSLVSAWTISIGTDEAGVHKPIEDPEWLTQFTSFLGFGETWADLIIALAVLLIIFSAAYDILAFTAFETNWVKYIISGGIAIAFGLVGGIGWFATFMVNIAGGSVMIATTIAIIIGIFFFIAGTFFKGKMLKLKYKAKAEKATGAMALAKAKLVGDVKAAKAAADAAESNT